jgi:hypothetical protein
MCHNVSTVVPQYPWGSVSGTPLIPKSKDAQVPDYITAQYLHRTYAHPPMYLEYLQVTCNS